MGKSGSGKSLDKGSRKSASQDTEKTLPPPKSQNSVSTDLHSHPHPAVASDQDSLLGNDMLSLHGPREDKDSTDQLSTSGEGKCASITKNSPQKRRQHTYHATFSISWHPSGIPLHHCLPNKPTLCKKKKNTHTHQI